MALAKKKFPALKQKLEQKIALKKELEKVDDKIDEIVGETDVKISKNKKI